ncbi:DnaJ-domain-containing protein [Cucurbitaria berberidis CBS 394.84]|uniref:DnaJ-domain-containing protein n=1 Tax=Cucurbitaria berberidis CBS 394.84 TaxID=1168544 RepID=A0A9P4GK09_9PLEO|nr:DnaJ-domain-containing protein [Cucurbitaria berberidis CBS 394.84]KAF1846854.1 DnaJ-domain-containing protein [Cucurbitaria berberidis CBS 394.84]
MSDTNKDLEDLAKSATEDFYELLGVSFDASEPTIKKAYRKASIRYHPDKNPDNKDAADRFIYLGWARDILIDAKLKGEYDRARTRRREKTLQDELLDGRRRKMKEDLERREKNSAPGLKRKRTEDMSEAERREQEIQRLAEDGKRRRKEAQERLEKKRQDVDEASFMEVDKSPEPQAQRPGDSAEIDRTVKIRFSREGDMADWDKDRISSMFAKYGKIDSVVIGKDKKIRPSGGKHRKVIAIVFVIYTRLDHAHAAVIDGQSDYPSLESVSWANGEPDIKSPTSYVNGNAPSAPSTPVVTPNKSFRASFGPGIGKGFGSTTPLGTPKFSFSPKTPSLEEVTMMRLKQAEKKRLEEQIRKQEAAEEAVA